MPFKGRIAAWRAGERELLGVENAPADGERLTRRLVFGGDSDVIAKESSEPMSNSAAAVFISVSIVGASAAAPSCEG